LNVLANTPPQRRFAIENPASIGAEEVDDDESTENGSPGPTSKKRKLGATSQAGGRIPKGKDFWSLVDTFFSKQIIKFGSKNLQSAGWKECTLCSASMCSHC
jgi:hypothetical protein